MWGRATGPAAFSWETAIDAVVLGGDEGRHGDDGYEGDVDRPHGRFEEVGHESQREREANTNRQRLGRESKHIIRLAAEQRVCEQ